MEECITHFSHEHPLNFFQLGDLEDPKPHRCRICSLPILSTPSYTCSINPNCNFFVHKACTQLPKEFYHRLHRGNLYLETSSNQNFSYRCNWNHSDCKFNLHPLVAQPLEIKSQHKCHESHPLIAFCREIVSLCDVCGDEETGFFFYCKECGFFVHQDCTILPSAVKLLSHTHPFILAYSLPFTPSHSSLGTNDIFRCCICDGEWRLPNGGVYFCGESYSLAHVACAKRSMENIIPDTEIVHLPDEEDRFPSLVIRTFVEKNPLTQNIIKVENKMMTKYHEHPLILEDTASISGAELTEDNSLCDVCKHPVNMSVSPIYRCQNCDFAAHRICADHLPARFESFIGSERVELLLHADQMEQFFCSVFPCGVCFRPTSGFSYILKAGDRNYFPLDVECIVAPKIVKHASHKQHVLFFTGERWISKINCKLSCCSSVPLNKGIYRCVVCEYSIHIGCALLPKTTRHKFDEHPLEMIIMNTHDDYDKRGVFCEVCEQDIELKWWYYGCRKCEHYFHINCIPSVGFMSKVKFGRAHVYDQLHLHPLVLTRMLTHQRNERCGICNKIIRGFSDDEMALHCSPCHFWIHFSCAAATTRLEDYSNMIESWS